MPLFSIIMPVYNNEKYFPIAVNSVLTQSYKDFELLIVDDGSTDNTPALADEIARRDARVTVIHQKNQWIYASFNNGIKRASGEYVYILNSDDRIRPLALEKMNEKIEMYHPDVIYTKLLAHRCDAEQNIIEYDLGNREKKVSKDRFYSCEQEFHEAWSSLYQDGFATTQANLYKRDIMLKHPFRNDVYGADMLFNIDIAYDIKTAYVMNSVVYEFLKYDNGKINESGKYYEYDHDMNNQIYLSIRRLYDSWNLSDEKYIVPIYKWRVRRVTRIVRALQAKSCKLSLNEKIKKIFNEFVDELVYGCALRTNSVEELEGRILSGTRELLVKETMTEDNEMYFVYQLLDSLLSYEKTKEDYINMEKAVNHPLNPYHIGKAFLDKLESGTRGDAQEELKGEVT